METNVGQIWKRVFQEGEGSIYDQDYYIEVIKCNRYIDTITIRTLDAGDIWETDWTAFHERFQFIQ